MTENKLDNILAEVSEHMSDCDFNRNSHFSQYQKFKSKSKVWNGAQKFLAIATTIIYILYFSDIFNSGVRGEVLKYFTLILSIFSTVVSTVLLFNNYDEKSNDHWQAAQSYQTLYRDCQFFHNDYLNNNDIGQAFANAYRIRRHLNNLNLLSPHISEKINKNTYDKLKDKSYNIKKNSNNNENKEIVNNIKKDIVGEYEDYKFDLYLFGGVLNNKSFKDSDIDLAMIFDVEDEIELIRLNSKAMNIRIKYLKKDEIILNIFVQSKNNFYNYIKNPFYKNIKEGKKLFSNITNECYITNYAERKDIIKKIERFIKICKNNIKDEFFDSAIINCYFAYYHCVFLLLTDYNNTWKSEYEMIRKFKREAYRIPNILLGDIEIYLECENYKNIVAYNYSCNCTYYEGIANRFLENLIDFKDRVIEGND